VVAFADPFTDDRLVFENSTFDNQTPTGMPSIAGTLKVGSTLTIDASTIQDPDNFTGYTPTYTYAWESSADGTTWSPLTTTDATDGNSTYTLTTADVGKKLRGVVSYVDGYGTSETLHTEPDNITGFQTMDLDGDNKVSITDTLLLMRSLLGTFPADKLVSGLSSSISADGARQRFQQIANQPNSLFGGNSFLDIDGDNQITPFTDGLMIGHYIHNEGHMDRPFIPDLVMQSGRDITDLHHQLQTVVGF